MAAICDMALGRLADRRYFLGIVHDGIKTGFMRKKEASSYIQMVFIVCCFLLTAPKKRKKIVFLVSVVNKSHYRDTHSEDTISNVRDTDYLSFVWSC